jgi:hypothetical protein
MQINYFNILCFLINKSGVIFACFGTTRGCFQGDQMSL